ncbi:hypothetical protein S40288_09551 [Stachybotrys chartarum IBT 40288]|nr:hypothetical protein S40288_09551 [Stachybotrys chartarum IBT 40288]
MASPPLNRAMPICFTIFVLSALLLNALRSPQDPYRCDALSNDGNWFNGNGAPYADWEPAGCMVRKYTRADIHRCVDGRPMVFSGDSTTSQVYWAMARLLDRERADAIYALTSYNETIDEVFDSLRLVNIWNPELKSGPANPDLTAQLNLLREERQTRPVTRRQNSAAFLLLGGGSWFAANNTDGSSLSKFTDALDSLTSRLFDSNETRLGQDLFDPIDGVGNRVFIAPVPQPSWTTPRGTDGGTLRGEMEAMNQFLASVEYERRYNIPWSFLSMSSDHPDTVADRNASGLHVIDAVAEAKANVLLNLRCNARLNAMDGYSSDYNCCSDYGRLSIVSAILFYALAVFATLCVAVELFNIRGQPNQPRSALFNLGVGIFAVALLACYLADRTQFFAKGNKHFQTFEFALLTLVALAAGALTWGKPSMARALLSGPMQPTYAGEDQPLSRDQTDEWKGWMQAFVLIYRWTSASESLGCYICFRLLVAGYLFQTGLGHTIYFLTTKDFSAKRFVTVIARLNLLPWILQYLVQTEYLFYYFAPLVSFWFIMIYVALAILPRYNDSLTGFLAKMALSALVFALPIFAGVVTNWLYNVFEDVAHVSWNVRDWETHVALDASAVYVGMIFGYAIHSGYFETHLNRSEIPAALGTFAILLYIFFSLRYDTPDFYNQWHPLLSFMPIVSYVALRNMNRFARTSVSRGFAWMGRYTLEIYMLQHHLLLAADGKGVLLLDLFNGDKSLIFDRWRDLVVLLPVLLWLSSQVHESTKTIVGFITHQDEDYVYEQLEMEKSGAKNRDGRLAWIKSRALGILRKVLTRTYWRNSLGVRLAGIVIFMGVLNWFS